MRGGRLKRAALPALVAYFVFCTNALSAIYGYTDEEGVIHFTNVPTSGDYEWVMLERPELEASYNPVTSIDDIIGRVSKAYGVDEDLVRAIIKVESDFDPDAVSEDGARGLMQLMPETARLVGVKNLHDPYENILGGVRYLSRLLKNFSWNIPLAVAAYNSGAGQVLKYRGVPPIKETRRYVKKVLHYYNKYRTEGLLK